MPSAALAEVVRLPRRQRIAKAAPSLAWVQTEWPWRGPRRGTGRASLRKHRVTPRSEIKRALRELQEAERRNASQEVLREKYFALEAALAADECDHEQLELELYETVRLDRRDRLTRLGKDPDPDRVFEDSAPNIQRFAEVFPDGMTFTEIGWVLGCRKQQAFKLYLRGTAKMLRALGADAEKIRDHLRAEAERASGWDQMMGT